MILYWMQVDINTVDINETWNGSPFLVELRIKSGMLRLKTKKIAEYCMLSNKNISSVVPSRGSLVIGYF